jgi:hypothetical protein
MAALVMFGLIASTVEIASHGLQFFFFRNQGAGAGNSLDLKENQGPGQPDAPSAHPSNAPSTAKPAPTPSKTN